jgi:hypothetical protein
MVLRSVKRGFQWGSSWVLFELATRTFKSHLPLLLEEVEIVSRGVLA